MRHRAKTRIGVAALTVVYSLLAFPLTAHADPGVSYITASGEVNFGSSGWCDEDGDGEAWDGYSREDDHGYYAVHDTTVLTGTTSGESIGLLNLCGELSRQPSDDPVLAAVGAACTTWGETAYMDPENGDLSTPGVPYPSGSNGYGRITYHSGALAGHYTQFSDVRMVFTPASGMVFRAEYTSSPGMPNASTGTAIIYAHMGDGSPLANNCLLFGGQLWAAWCVGGSVALIPDVE